MTRSTRPLAVLAVTVLVLGGAACGDSDGEAASPAAGAELVGLFGVDRGQCDGGDPTGSWFKMVQSGGTVEDGPYVDNVDSPCEDTTTTPLLPGTDGGLRTDGYQPQPDPAFAEGGGSRAEAIIAPTPFFAVPFGLSTNEADPQTGRTVGVPTLSTDAGALAGDLSALSVSWNGQHFNQGAPKPGAGDAGALSGTYDPETDRYTLDWTSPIEDGPFDGFTGVWHLEGTFDPA